MRATVRLAHDCYDRDLWRERGQLRRTSKRKRKKRGTHSTRRPHRLRPQLRQQDVPDLLRYRTDNVDQTGNDRTAVLLRDLSLESVEIGRVALLVGIEEEADDLCADAESRLCLIDVDGDHPTDEKVERVEGRGRGLGGESRRVVVESDGLALFCQLNRSSGGVRAGTADIGGGNPKSESDCPPPSLLHIQIPSPAPPLQPNHRPWRPQQPSFLSDDFRFLINKFRVVDHQQGGRTHLLEDVRGYASLLPLAASRVFC